MPRLGPMGPADQEVDMSAQDKAGDTYEAFIDTAIPGLLPETVAKLALVLDAADRAKGVYYSLTDPEAGPLHPVLVELFDTDPNFGHNLAVARGYGEHDYYEYDRSMCQIRLVKDGTVFATAAVASAAPEA